jgi:hypothetical protein
MGLDVRVPVGLMLGIMGVLLLGYGLLGDHSIYARSLGLNINAIWGGVLLAVAAILLVLAARRPRASAGHTGGARHR